MEHRGRRWFFFFLQTYYHLASTFPFFCMIILWDQATLEHLPANLLCTQESVVSPSSHSIVKMSRMTHFSPLIYVYMYFLKFLLMEWLVIIQSIASLKHLQTLFSIYRYQTEGVPFRNSKLVCIAEYSRRSWFDSFTTALALTPFFSN